MIDRRSKILQSGITMNSPLIKRASLLCFALLLFCSQNILAQVINNTGAAISVSSIAVVNSKDLSNTSGSLGNNGTINLTGNFSNGGTSGGNGLFNITGNWTNTNIFNPGTSTVTFNGTINQTITHWSSGENFYKLIINNPGNIITQVALPGDSLTVNNDLTITAGTLSLGPSTSKLKVGGRATITAVGSALIYDNSRTQTATISDILSGAGVINMSGGNLPHVLNLAGSTNAIGTFTTSPASSSTVNYYGITQTVFPAANYRNLTISNSGVKTLQGNSVVNLRLLISGGTFDLGTVPTTLNVLGSTKIIGSLAFDGTTPKTVTLNDSLTGAGAIDMSGGNLAHRLLLNGTVNSIGTYSSGTGSTVDYILNGNQSVFISNDYRNMRIIGSGVKTLYGDITAKGILTMSSGDINSNGNTLKISNSALGAIVRTTGTVIGKLQRATGFTTGDYLYPIGDSVSYNPLKLKFQNLTSGPVTAQFKPKDIGWTGPPLDDNGDEIYDRFTRGYWTLTSFVPMASNNFNVKLDYTGFLGVDKSSRIIRRNDGGSFEVDGKNDSTSLAPEIKRDSLLKGISAITTDFAIGLGRPRIVSQPVNMDICEWENAFFQVTARGGSGSLSYKWQVDITGTGTAFNNITDVGVYSGSSTRKLTITGAPYSMNGYLYRCIITDGQGNFNITNIVLLTVNKIPVAVATPSAQDECPGVAFQPIVLSTSNTVTGTTFTWSRNNPAGITAFGLPLSGTAIGDQITGTFSNSTDSPVAVTFTITPTGPVTTHCIGVNIFATVTVNPTPRIFPVPANTAQCDSTTTTIQLQSPSTFTTGSISFDHSYTTSGPVTGFTTPTTGQLNNSFITDKLVNQTNVFQVVTYSVIPVSPVPGCAAGPTKSFTVTVNPTPRVFTENPNNLRPDSSICYGGSTNIRLRSLTQMSPGYGNIRLDYKVSITGGTGWVIGDTTRVYNRIPGDYINRSYQNISDTLQSVYYTITPKVDNAICNKGPVFISQIKVHPKPNRRILLLVPLTCFGGSDATLSAVTSKGVNPLKFYWEEPFNRKDTILTIANGRGGSYRLTITDNLGCNNYRDTVVQGAFIDTYLLAYPKGTGNEVTCPGGNDGEIWLQVNSGGTPVYEYWLTRNTLDTSLALIHDTLGSPGRLKKYLNQFYQGTYTLSVKDANGCFVNNSTQTVNEPAPITVTFGKKPYNGYDVRCRTDANGKAWVKTITGGNGGYAYQWRNSGGTIIGTSDTISNLSAGTYYLRTIDSQGCPPKMDSVTIYEPPGMGLSGIVLKTSRDNNYNISCNGYKDGKITLNITGGSGSYTYVWTRPDGTDTTTIVNEISGLIAGHYKAIVRDINNCTLSPLDTILIQPPALIMIDTLSIAPDGLNNIKCFGETGKIGLTVSGGSVGTYHYNWSTSNGSGIIPGQKDQPDLTTGTYTITVVDSNLCQISRNITLSQPQRLSSTLVPKHITCFPAGFSNGSIDLTASGGITPYQYTWSNGATTEDISGLTQGYYKVTVKDFNGCQRPDSVRINLPPNLTFTSRLSLYDIYNISCNGNSDGKIIITPVTGRAPYSYSWTGTGFSSAQRDSITGLKAGPYNLQITDSNLCTASGSFNLTEPAKLAMTITPSASSFGNYNINCTGASTGTINITPVNNVGRVDYKWKDGDTSKMRSSLNAGTYDVIIIDRNNCQAQSSIVLTQPDSIKISFTVKQAYCPDSQDGEVQLNVTGGVITSDYSYKWSDNSISRNLSDIMRGKYLVAVTDANNCMVKDSVIMDPLHETCLSIPNAISPNNDNINDVWNIGKIDLYPQAEVKVFNRWGILLWNSEKGYPHPWDGRSSGTVLPIDSYTYIIDLHNGRKPLIGNITIVR
jgi:gliding motility-associated-like protein